MDTINAVINHPATSPVAVSTLIAATPTVNTIDIIIKLGGMVIALIPAIKQLFPKRKLKS